ncbi:MAG: Spy/CpxP family protein refolding chaperone [Chromatiales bacterium]
MTSNSTKATLTALALATAALLGTEAGAGQNDWAPCPGKGPGMMGGPGQGMYPGMAPQGRGGPHRMGQGMGRDPQSMRGGAEGMPGPAAGQAEPLDLSDEQSEKMRKLSDDLRKKHWELMGQMMDKRAALRDLYSEERPDPEAVGNAYEEIAKLQRQMIQSRIESQNRMLDLLTEEQRERMKQAREAAMSRSAMPRPGMMAPGMPGEAGDYGQPGQGMAPGMGRGMGPGQGMPERGMDQGMGYGYPMGPGHGMGPGSGMMGRGPGMPQGGAPGADAPADEAHSDSGDAPDQGAHEVE